MSLAGKFGYKETEVGWIPDDWRCEHLGGHISMLTGAPFKSELFSSSEGVPLIRIRDLLRGFSETGYVGEYDERYIVNTGDVLVGMDGEFHVVRWKGSRALLNQRVLKISHRPGISDLGFLFFLVAAAIGKIQDGISATTVKHLSTKDLQNLMAALPPLPEQQKIAAILSTVDDKLDVIARQIEATQTLKQGLMQALFSRGVGTQDADGRWVPHAEFKDSELGEIPTGWSTGQLLTFLELQRGVDLPVQDRRLGEVPIFGSNGVLGFHDSSICNGPGVITGRSGTIGKVFYTETLYWPLNTSLYVKDFKGNHHKFVYYKLASIGLDKFSTGTGVPTLNRNVAHKEMVAFPSFNEQQEIAKILTCLDEKISVLEQRAASTQSLKRGLMHKLLTGEWRVNVDASATET